MSDFLYHAFGVYQLQELWALVSWIYMHTLGLIPVMSLVRYINSFGWWSLVVYVPVCSMLFSFSVGCVRVLCVHYKGIFYLFCTHLNPNKFYKKRLPLLITPRVKYLNQYRGDNVCMTWNLFAIALFLMFLIWIIPIPFGKFILYFILLCLLVIYVSQVFHYGYMRLMLILSGIVFAHIMLATGTHFSFVLTPHEKFLGFITVNATDYSIDISRLYFAIILLFSYIALFRYICNHFKWKYLEDEALERNQYHRNFPFFGFGLLSITELTQEELNLWNTQREKYESTALYWMLSIVYLVTGITWLIVYVSVYYPFLVTGQIRHLRWIVAKIKKVDESILIFKKNRFLAEWRLDSEMDGVTRTKEEINQSLNNFLVYIRKNLNEDDADLKERLYDAFPDFDSLTEIDTVAPVEQVRQAKPVVTPMLEKESLPEILKDIGCTPDTIKMITRKYNLPHISKAIHIAKQSEMPKQVLFQTLES